MATEIWRKFSHLSQDLLDNGGAYSFYQAVRLLNTLLGDDGAKGHQGVSERLRLIAAPDLAFPAGDIRAIKIDEQERLELKLNFMGLCGVDSPLPHYFLQAAAGEENEALAFQEFFAIFNRRIYELLFRAWQKHHPPLTRDAAHISNRYLAALTGNMGLTGQPEVLTFASTMGNRVKNGAGLTGVVREFLGDIKARVQQFAPTWVKVDNQAALGADGEEGLSLGRNCILGERILDVSRKVKIEIGPMPASRAKELLPGRDQARRLARLIRHYLPLTITFDIILLVRPDQKQQQVLGGGEELMLGWNTCLGEWLAEVARIAIPSSVLAEETTTVG
ncbi:MAG: type VI secretion system baseplate subunit TssG [Thermodesulfobacteriota bacterium]